MIFCCREAQVFSFNPTEGGDFSVCACFLFSETPAELYYSELKLKYYSKVLLFHANGVSSKVEFWQELWNLFSYSFPLKLVK